MISSVCEVGEKELEKTNIRETERQGNGEIESDREREVSTVKLCGM